jgi:hypothetical protein
MTLAERALRGAAARASPARPRKGRHVSAALGMRRRWRRPRRSGRSWPGRSASPDPPRRVGLGGRRERGPRCGGRASTVQIGPGLHPGFFRGAWRSTTSRSSGRRSRRPRARRAARFAATLRVAPRASALRRRRTLGVRSATEGRGSWLRSGERPARRTPRGRHGGGRGGPSAPRIDAHRVPARDGARRGGPSIPGAAAARPCRWPGRGARGTPGREERAASQAASGGDPRSGPGPAGMARAGLGPSAALAGGPRPDLGAAALRPRRGPGCAGEPGEPDGPPAGPADRPARPAPVRMAGPGDLAASPERGARQGTSPREPLARGGAPRPRPAARRGQRPARSPEAGARAAGPASASLAPDRVAAVLRGLGASRDHALADVLAERQPQSLQAPVPPDARDA